MIFDFLLYISASHSFRGSLGFSKASCVLGMKNAGTCFEVRRFWSTLDCFRSFQKTQDEPNLKQNTSTDINFPTQKHPEFPLPLTASLGISPLWVLAMLVLMKAFSTLGSANSTCSAKTPVPPVKRKST